MPEPFLLWINTFILILSSIFFVRIQLASKKNELYLKSDDVEKIENFIDDLRVDTTLGQLADKTKKSVDYKNTFPAHAQPAKNILVL